MFKIENKTFHVSRTEAGSFTLKSKNNPFSAGDNISLKIYNVDALDEEPLATITSGDLSEDTNEITLTFLGNDTNFSEPTSEIQTYWYEIRSSEKILIGFDQNGPKLFYLYPSGK